MKLMNISRRAALGLAGAVLIGASTPLAALADVHADHLASLDRVKLDGNTLAYLDLGASDAPAVMLIHGIPTSSYLFRDVAPQIAAAGYRVIAPDLMGFGASDKPADPAAYATEARSARLFALADHLGIENFALVLHDVGGITGWQMVEDAPDRLTAVVATNTMAGLAGVTPAPAVIKIMSQQATPQEVFAPMATSEGAEALALMWLEQGWFGPGSVPASETTVYAADTKGASIVYETFFEQAVPAFMMGEEARNVALAAFGGPTAIIFGEQDAYFDADVVVVDLQARLGTPDANITRISDAGHYLQAQAPEAYVSALTGFLKAEVAD